MGSNRSTKKARQSLNRRAIECYRPPRESGQSNSALAMIELSIAESSSIAAKPNDSVAGVHILIVQKETLADVLAELGRVDDADAARREADELRAYLPPPPRDRRHQGALS